jgi:hypothetical protein
MNARSFSALERVRNVSAATAYLKLGWELVETHTRLFGEGAAVKEGDTYLVYILGWPRELGPEKDPNRPDKGSIDL